jgi:hypothetical protein
MTERRHGGRLSTIRRSQMDVTTDELSDQFGYAIRALTNITNAFIRVFYSNAVVNRSIASALENHPALRLFALECKASFLQAYVTVLSTLPNLKTFAFIVCIFDDPQVLSFDEAEAIVELLRMDRPLSIELRLHGCTLTDPATIPSFALDLLKRKCKTSSSIAVK